MVISPTSNFPDALDKGTGQNIFTTLPQHTIPLRGKFGQLLLVGNDEVIVVLASKFAQTTKAGLPSTSAGLQSITPRLFTPTRDAEI